jgi:hypothetical protein
MVVSSIEAGVMRIRENAAGLDSSSSFVHDSIAAGEVNCHQECSYRGFPADYVKLEFLWRTVWRSFDPAVGPLGHLPPTNTSDNNAVRCLLGGLLDLSRRCVALAP